VAIKEIGEFTVVSGKINPDWDCLQANHVEFFPNRQFDLFVLDP
jgi:hypothetical protein